MITTTSGHIFLFLFLPSHFFLILAQLHKFSTHLSSRYSSHLLFSSLKVLFFYYFARKRKPFHFYYFLSHVSQFSIRVCFFSLRLHTCNHFSCGFFLSYSSTFSIPFSPLSGPFLSSPCVALARANRRRSSTFDGRQIAPFMPIEGRTSRISSCPSRLKINCNNSMSHN